jgi:methyl-accepting chemotaxis protein
MDWDAAISAHTNWKLRIFKAAKNGNQEKLDPSIVGKDNECALGQWLHGEGKSVMAAKPEYQELIKLHADFHRQAASLITLIAAGQVAQAEGVLGDKNSAFSQSSLKVVGLLMRFKSASKEARTQR